MRSEMATFDNIVLIANYGGIVQALFRLLQSYQNKPNCLTVRS